MDCWNLRQFRGAGLFDDLLIAIQILEDFLRRAQRLLEDVVNAGEPLDGFVQHQQRDDEAGEFSGRERVILDLDARVGQQYDDGDGGEEFDQRARRAPVARRSGGWWLSAGSRPRRNRLDSRSSVPNDFTTWWPLMVSCRI